MSDSAYIKIENVGQFVNKSQIGDASQVETNLQFTLTLPTMLKVDDRLRVLIEGPHKSSYVDLILTSEDVIAHEILMTLPSTSVANDSNQFVDGDYQVTLESFNSIGETASIEGSALFTLDTAAPSSPSSVNIYDHGDDVLNAQEIAQSLILDIGIDQNSRVGDEVQIDLNGDGAIDITHILQAAEIGETLSVKVNSDQFELDSGEAVVSVAIKDAAGNISLPVSDVSQVEVNTLASTAHILRVKDNHAAYKGFVDSGDSTNDISPKLVGRLDAKLQKGEFLNVYRDGELIGRAVIQKQGKKPVWRFKDNDKDDALIDGQSYNYTVQMANASGETGVMSQAYSINIDTSSPTPEAIITSMNDGVDALISKSFTNQASPIVQGTLSESLATGEYLRVVRNGRVLGKANIDDSDPENIVWQFEQQGLRDGQYTYRVQIVDAASNKGAMSEEFVINIDTDVPQEVKSVVIQNTNNDTFDQNELDAQITVSVGLSYKAKAGNVIEIDVSGDGVADAVHTITRSELGKVVDITIASKHFEIKDNAVSASVKVVDKASNESAVSIDRGELLSAYSVELNVEKLDVIQNNGELVVGFDVDVIKTKNSEESSEVQKVSTNAPQGTEITIDISIDILGAGIVQLNSFTVIADENGDYTFDKNSVPDSAWKDFSGLLSNGSPISNVKIEAYVESSDVLKSNVAAESILYRTSPLILDFNGDGVETLSIDEGISFDINNDAKQEFTGWVSAEDGLLVRDINNDGEITDSSELFGEFTIKQSNGLRASDGFDALADLDSNKDGVFDKNDTAFDEVKIWQDSNSDGISNASELKTLDEMGVKSINLDAQIISEANEGNTIGLRSSWTDTQEESHDVDDVWFEFKQLDETIAPYVKVIKSDEYFNATEVGDAASVLSSIQVKAVIPPGTALGEIISIKVEGPSGEDAFRHITEAADFVRGYILFNIPNKNIQDATGEYNDGLYELTLDVFTPAGAHTPYAGTDSFILDTIAPIAPVVEIVDGADSTLNIEELSKPITVNIALSANTVAGDKVDIDFNNDGVIDLSYVVKNSDVGGVISFDVSPADLGIDRRTKTVKVNVNVTDLAGNIGDFASAESGVDNRAPDSPMSIEIINGADNLLDFGELSADVSVKIKLFETAKVGEELLVDVNGDGIADVTHIIVLSDLSGFVNVLVPGNVFKVDVTAEKVTATAWVVDKAGNVGSSISDTSGVIIDVTPDAAAIVISDDANNNEVLNFSELGNNTQIETIISIEGNHKIGDTLSVFSSTHTGNPWKEVAVLTQKHINDGFVVYEVPRPGENETLVVKTKVTGVWGKVSAESSDQAFIDTIGPIVSIETASLVITKDPVTVEFNFDEAAKGFNANDVDVVGGDLSKLKKVNDTTWSATFTADDSNLIPSITIDNAKFTDVHDNAGTGSKIEFDLKTIKPDTVSIEISDDINNDAVLNDAELGSATTISTQITLGDNTKAGDSLRVWHNAPAGGWELVKVLTQADINNGEVSYEVPRVLEGETLKVKAQVVSQYDVRGDTSDSDTALVDTQGPQLEISSSQASINDLPVNVVFTFNEAVTGFELDDISVSGGALEALTKVTDTKWTATFTSDGSTISPSIQVADDKYTDDFSNNGTGDELVMTYIPRPDKPIVEIKEDANNDGVLNEAELGSLNKITSVVTLGANNQRGDVIHLAYNNGAKQAYTLTDIDVNRGEVEFEVLRVNEGETLTISAHVSRAGAEDSAVSPTDQALVDTQGPVVEISVGSNNIAEKPVSVTFNFNEKPIGFKASDISIKGGDLTLFVKISDTQWKAVFTSDQLDAKPEITINNDQFKDQYGNEGTGDSLAMSFVPRAPDAATIKISEDSNNDGVLSSGELKNQGTVTTRINLNGDIVAGDTLRIWSNSFSGSKWVTVKVLTDLDINDGHLFYEVPKLGHGETLIVKTKTVSETGTSGDVSDTDQALIDIQGPTLEISGGKATSSGVPINFTFSEDTKGFDINDVEVTNGSLSDFTKVSDTLWTANFESDNSGLDPEIIVEGKDFTDLYNNKGVGDDFAPPANLEGVEFEAIERSEGNVGWMWRPCYSDWHNWYTYGVLNLPQFELLDTNDEIYSVVISGLDGGVQLQSSYYYIGTSYYRTTVSGGTNEEFDLTALYQQGDPTLTQALTLSVLDQTLFTRAAKSHTDTLKEYAIDFQLTVRTRDTNTGEISDPQTVSFEMDIDEVTRWVTPLVLDLDGDGVETQSIVGSNVRFDLDGDGNEDKVGWVGKDDGLLVRDLNGDGIINDGTELFGEATEKSDDSKAIDGFGALRDLDSNQDNVFDKLDDAFDEVQIWQDKNSDGVSQAHELYSLVEAGVESINLGAAQIAENNNGNFVGLRSTWRDTNGNDHDIDDVWFATQTDNNQLDLSDLLESESIGIDDLDRYLHFEQSGKDLLIYVDGDGRSASEVFTKEDASQMITLQQTVANGSGFDAILNTLIENNQVIIDQ